MSFYSLNMSAVERWALITLGLEEAERLERLAPNNRDARRLGTMMRAWEWGFSDALKYFCDQTVRGLMIVERDCVTAGESGLPRLTLTLAKEWCSAVRCAEYREG